MGDNVSENLKSHLSTIEKEREILEAKVVAAIDIMNCLDKEITKSLIAKTRCDLTHAMCRKAELDQSLANDPTLDTEEKRRSCQTLDAEIAWHSERLKKAEAAASNAAQAIEKAILWLLNYSVAMNQEPQGVDTTVLRCGLEAAKNRRKDIIEIIQNHQELSLDEARRMRDIIDAEIRWREARLTEIEGTDFLAD